MTYITIDVNESDVLGNFSVAELLDELQTRDDYEESGTNWTEIFELLLVGRNDDALALIRDISQERTGRVLP